MQKDFDPEKNYVFVEDNGDGTTTFVMNIPDLDVRDTAIVVNMPLMAFVESLMVLQDAETINTNMTENYGMQAVIIPNDPEEV